MNGFRSVVGELWDALGLGAPAFAADDSIMLETETVAVRLSPGNGGRRMVLSAAIRPLADDAHERAVQVRQVLQSNMRHLRVSPASVLVRGTDSGEAIVIQRNIDYSYGGTGAVAEAIDRFCIHFSNVYRLLSGEEAGNGGHQNTRVDGGKSQDSEFIFRL
ncbi:MAG: hypothetical protein ACOYJQ_13290 [Pseudochelatococcus sp.]|jgi:hypothetical protein|uniref:hypothetical protein n=1 Tax=Pseudochelatococcus sp. TaxID=2020869 RepID=UPI003D8D8DCB